MSGVRVEIDARDVARLAGVLVHLPTEIREKAVYRAFKRVGEQVRSAVIRKAATDSGMRPSDVRAVTRLPKVDGQEIIVSMRSEWWPLYKLGGATQTRRGVRVRGWGPHKGAFLPQVGAGHTGVFRRTGPERLPIKELWGPNPVANVLKTPDTYEGMLRDIMAARVAPQVLKEVEFLLSKAG